MDGTSATRHRAEMTATKSAGTLYGWGNSPFAYKVLMAAAHTGVPLDWRVASLADCMQAKKKTGTHKTPFLATREGEWITDSTTISAWLEARATSGASLLPSDARARAECLLLEDWADEGLNRCAEPFIWIEGGRFGMVLDLVVGEQTHTPSALLFRVMSPYMRRRWQGRVDAHGGVEGTRKLLCAQLDLIEARIAAGGGAWVLGDAPTIADFAIAGQLANLVRFQATRELDARPKTATLVRAACAGLPWARA
jgi:glutathione S-transferase